MELIRRSAPVLAGYALVVAGLLATRGFVLPFVVAGGSMRPALSHGDLVLVARGGRVERGDVVLLAPPGYGRVLHRVVEVSPGGWVTTRGDANPIPDARPSRASEVEGRVVAVVPVGTWVERWRGGGGRATLSTQSNISRR